MDARIAFPVFRPAGDIKNLSYPDYFTALGLLRLGLAKMQPSPKERKKKVKKKKDRSSSPWWKDVVQVVIDYVDDDKDSVMQ